ncbi:hypothetical protein JCM5350_005760 [Sporobolomyces pararoseus]
MGTRSTPAESLTTFWSGDLNVSISGHIISEVEPGQSEGVVFELAIGSDAVQIKHPQLVTISTRPESQTLRSINTGEALFTLETPLLPPRKNDLDSTTSGTEGEGGEGEEEEQEEGQESTAKQDRRITLHSGLIQAKNLDISTIQTSPLFSQTFQILIDSPSFPPPHFDPASLAPPTPSFRPVDHNSSSSANFLNSPTLQRALLSPLLSPQRRAASQGSDMSVPPLSLGLSRTSRASFSADNRGPLLRPNSSSSSSQPAGLLALIPSLLPSNSTSTTASTNTTNSTASPSITASSATVPQTPPVSASDPHSLASSLTASISTSAKKTAEDILNLRRNHDTFVRRAKAELEVLETRIESVRNGANGGSLVGGGGVVRGFGVPVIFKKDGQDRSESGSRERGRTSGRSGRAASLERSPLGDNDSRKESTTTKEVVRDEDVSSKMREMDQKEEDERGRSRSRQRRREDPRSLSRTKKIAEATEAAAMGAKEKEKRGGDMSRERDEQEKDGRDIPATLADGDEDEDSEKEDTARTGRSGSSLRPPSGGSAGGTTPTFIPSSATKGLVAIPETEELSLPPSETSRATSPDDRGGQNRQRTVTSESEREEDAPFEMDEDVDVDFMELASSRPIFQQQPPDFGTYEPVDSVRSPSAANPSASTFRPGSLQRASSLSASYAALLSSTSGNSNQRPVSPLENPPTSEATTPSSGSVSRDHPMTTSVKEDVVNREAGSLSSPPNPSDVRRGEQKIRDVLAIDVPSHRRALPRKNQPGGGVKEDLQPSDHSSEDEEEGEERDNLGNLLSPSSKFQVGSLPIPLANRPSTRAMSSWRPDPEREWALEREKRQAAGGGGGGSLSRPSREGSSWIPPPVDPKSSIDDQSSTPRSAQVAAVPLEIGGGGSTSSQGNARPIGGGISSSLAQSLRNAPSESFASRANREQAGPPSEQLHIPSGDDEGAGEGDEEEEEEEDGVFLPPHLVADRRARKDEKYLSRSVSRS